MAEFKEVFLPENKNVLDVLVELGGTIKNAWIFMDSKCFEELMGMRENGVEHESITGGWLFKWKNKKAYRSEMSVINETRQWKSILRICSPNIWFKYKVDNPSLIIMLKKSNENI